VKGQKKEEEKPVEVEGVEEWEIERILNKKKINIIATTYWNSTCSLLTSAKLLTGYLVVRITRELDKELSLHCYPIYISYRWSMLQ